MTTVAEKTKYSGIFNNTYWGGFKVKENKLITNTIISARDDFAEKYCIAQPVKGNLDSELTCAIRDDRVWDHVEIYRVQTTPNSVVVVVSPYHADTTKLLSLGFSSCPKLYHENASTFVKIFKDRAHLRAFIGRRQQEQNQPHRYRPGPEPELIHDAIHPCFEGTVIFASPGSGKTWLSNTINELVIDADNLILQKVGELYPSFDSDPEIHPGKNLLNFCQRYSRQALDHVYEEVSDAIDCLTYQNGCIVVTGSIALMSKAEFVFIQTNGALLRTGYDQTREKEEALRLGKYIPIDWYLADVLQTEIDS